MDSDFILRYIMTSEQKYNLINLIEVLLEDIFKNNAKPSPNSSFEKKALEIIYFELEKRKIENNPKEMEVFLQKLLGDTKAMPELKLTISIAPTEDLIGKLKDWAETNGYKNLTFDISVDPQLIAGAIIISNKGKYIKYSLSDMLDEYFASNKLELMNLL
jgi:F0F1-type ATP synthase delta subunit